MTTDDRIEQIARLVDPKAWWLRDWIVSSPERDRLNQGRRAAGFPDEDKVVASSLETARQIAALPCKGGEAVAWLKEWTDGKGVKQRVVQLSQNDNRWVDAHFVTTMTPLYATPTPEAGRMREALEEAVTDAVHRVAKRTSLEGYSVAVMREGIATILAALSDQPQQEKP
ncbi:MAG: hypothetical protein KKA05_10490 [Alphaproteobacteria bacterium]|nr:hypothetical protein [Alphaproteobacteria bacterium]MBU0860339.1 hypothetical protein [Alphaproteobacteria bacterium]